MSVSVKTFLRCGAVDDSKWEIRRFFVPSDVAHCFVYMQEKLSSIVYPSLKNKQFNVHWKDDEGDLIIVSSDDELMTALTCRKDDILRLYIKVKSNKSSTEDFIGSSSQKESSKDGKDASEEVHPLVTCDGCNNSICGFRYKCMECPDYDLCRACESKKTHSQHFMIRMPRPTDTNCGFMPWLFGRHGRGHGKGSSRRLPTFGGFGHRRSHCHRGGSGSGGEEKNSDDCRNEQQNGAGCDAGDQPHVGSPPVFPFHQMLDKIWTALGGLPTETGQAGNGTASGGATAAGFTPTSGNVPSGAQNPFMNEEFLKKVGETVAAVLDPLGINVDVDVEHRNGQRQHCTAAFSGSGNKCGFTDKPDQRKENDSGEVSPSKESSPVVTADKDVPIPMPMTPLQTVVEPTVENEKVVENVASPKRPASPQTTTIVTETGDWTYIGDKDQALIAQNITPIDVKSSNGGAKPKIPAGLPTPSLATDAKQEIQHPNPAVRDAMKQMLSMGFTNEGGWLTQLLEVKAGDIDSVLEVLQPVKKNSK